VAFILGLFKSLLDLPGIILQFIQHFKKTPGEKSESIKKDNAEESQKFEESGRPKWE
jgi:hypothetical protein